MPTGTPHPRATKLALTAAALGVGYAAVSIYWSLGGIALLDTVGGQLAEVGRGGGVAAVLLAGGAAAAKLVAAVLPVAALRTDRRDVRALAWAAAVVLLGYGSLLTGVGLLIQSGVVSASADADHRALAWHAYVWDPWFLVWGALGAAALLASRNRAWEPGGQALHDTCVPSE